MYLSYIEVLYVKLCQMLVCCLRIKLRLNKFNNLGLLSKISLNYQPIPGTLLKRRSHTSA